MRIDELISAKSIAAHMNEVASNKIPYLGEGLFPAKKKLGLDLSWLVSTKGLPISLAPSNFDAKSTLRAREGFEKETTQMAFFRESMLVKEKDEQEIMRILDKDDPYAKEVVARIYDDVSTLVDGAMVVPERMRMALLAPVNAGSPGITIASDNKQYTYNYDPNGKYAANNYAELTTATDKWSDTENSDPLSDILAAADKVEENTGSRPAHVLVSKQTMTYLRKNAKVQNAILAKSVTASVYITDALVNQLFKDTVGVDFIVYNKMFKDESGTAQKFYPDGYATLIPDGALGSTWFGTTPEERTLMGKAEANVSIVNTGVAVAVSVTEDPVNTKTTVSEIVLPSFERMYETYVIKAY